MNNAGGHAIILAGVGLAALALGYTVGADRPAEPDTVVVTLPNATPEPAARAPVAQPHKASATPSDRASLARELQRELTRVGCYEGEISGVWTTSSRMAMRTFIDRVNAALPIDNPDHILLALVQGHRDRACGTACPVGQVRAEDGRCLVNAIVTGANRTAEPPEPKPAPAADPAGAASAPTAALAAGLASLRGERGTAPSEPPEPSRAVREERPRVTATAPAAQAPAVPMPVPVPVPATRKERPQPAVRDSAPVPPEDVYQRRRKQTVRHAPSQPPKFARDLIRQIQKAASIFGLR